MNAEQPTAAEFDRRFDEGESVIPYDDLSKAERPNRKTQKVNVISLHGYGWFALLTRRQHILASAVRLS